MSPLVHDLGQQVTRASGDWLPGVFLLVVLATTFVLLVGREAARGNLPAHREQRAHATVVVVGPLVVCLVLAVGARWLEWAS